MMRSWTPDCGRWFSGSASGAADGCRGDGLGFGHGHADDDLMARLTAYEASGIRGHLAGGVSFYSKLVIGRMTF